MRRAYWVLLLVLWRPAAAELVDRIAVVVGNTAITESEVLQEVQVTAFLNGTQPDLSPVSKRQAAERLVEQELLRREIAVSRYIEPEESGTEETLQQVRRRYASAAEFQKALQRYDITEAEMKKHIAWQLTLLRFTEFRFRQGNVDQQMDSWLKEARSRTPVEFREEVFR